jgi:hypothetical protein
MTSYLTNPMAASSAAHCPFLDDEDTWSYSSTLIFYGDSWRFIYLLSQQLHQKIKDSLHNKLLLVTYKEIWHITQKINCKTTQLVAIIAFVSLEHFNTIHF